MTGKLTMCAWCLVRKPQRRIQIKRKAIPLKKSQPVVVSRSQRHSQAPAWLSVAVLPLFSPQKLLVQNCQQLHFKYLTPSVAKPSLAFKASQPTRYFSRVCMTSIITVEFGNASKSSNHCPQFGIWSNSKTERQVATFTRLWLAWDYCGFPNNCAWSSCFSEPYFAPGASYSGAASRLHICRPEYT